MTSDRTVTANTATALRKRAAGARAEEPMAPPGDDLPPKPRISLRRMLPLAVIVGALVAFFALGLERYVSFETLKTHRAALTDFVAARSVLAGALFVLVYAVATAVSLPGGAVLTIAGGFLFGTVLGSVYVIVGATLGATALFLAARTALGDALRARAGPALWRMEKGFREHAMSYLLFLRLIPAFPFWLVNLVPAFLGVPLSTYFIGTLLGIIPGSVVYASVGSGLGAVFDAGETPDLGIIFKPEILLPIIGLAVLALLPIAYKKYRAKKTDNGA